MQTPLLAQFGLLAIALTAQAAEPPAAKPNIIVFFSDDAGYADFGFQPNCAEDIKGLTPHIDRIASEGARFTNAYMPGSVCSPARAGLMTARYQQRFGFDNNIGGGGDKGLDLKETFAVNYLKELGYHTGLIGKWHLGYPEAYHPNKRGFDWFYGCLQGHRSFYAHPGNISPNQVILENSTPTPEDGYVTDRFGDAACRFIKENEEKPFFLFVSFTAPHSPLEPREDLKERIAKLSPSRGRANYLGLMINMDDNVGKIMACLKEQGLDDNTLVVFTNDNGGSVMFAANNNPLRDQKGSFMEGGIRVPWAVRWNGKIKPGSVVDTPVTGRDLFPTMIEAAGGTIKPEWKLDGGSFLGNMTGQGSTLPDDRPLFWRMYGSEGEFAMRQGDWKLYTEEKMTGRAPLLFNLAEDLGEQHDLAAQHPEKLKAMLAQLNAWNAELVRPHWGPGSEGFKHRPPSSLDREQRKKEIAADRAEREKEKEDRNKAKEARQKANEQGE